MWWEFKPLLLKFGTYAYVGKKKKLEKYMPSYYQ